MPIATPIAMPKRVALALSATLLAAPLAAFQAAIPPKALIRVDPKVYDVRYEVIIAGFPAYPESASAVSLANTPLVLPLVLRGGTNQIDPRSMQPELWFDSRRDNSLSSRARIDEGKPLGMVYAVLPVERFNGSSLRWAVSWRCQQFSTMVDESLLARITWPREWPKDVQDALQPQVAIESDAPVVGRLVDAALGDKAKQMPPWYAAKEVMRSTIIAFKSIKSSAMERRGQGRVVGMGMVGAKQSLEEGRGSSYDLVAACVAGLRRAGIPARPVVGLAEETTGGGLAKRTRTVLSAWCELYLPDAGWIPFDPNDTRKAAVRQLRVDQAWRGVGSIDDLNERITISHCFMPEGMAGSDWPAIWGWQPWGRIDATTYDTSVGWTVTSRGKGTPDP